VRQPPRRGHAPALLLLLLAGIATACVTARPPWYGELEAIGIRFMTAAREVKGMMDRGERFLLIDARDEVHYRNGRLPGAISIPTEDAPLRAVDIRRPKRLSSADGLPADRTRRLVFYCGGVT
jgi:3-mercaptopyruvate sulfurtransferase SseA